MLRSAKKKTQPLTKINRNLSIISEVVRVKKDTKIQKSAIKYSTYAQNLTSINSTKSIPWTLTVARQVKKYPTFYEIRRFILVFTTAGHLIPFRASCIWFPSLHLTFLDISQNTNSCYEDRYNISQPYCVLS